MVYITIKGVKQLEPTPKYMRDVRAEIVPRFSSCNRNSVASGYCLIDPVFVRHYKKRPCTKPKLNHTHSHRRITGH